MVTILTRGTRVGLSALTATGSERCETCLTFLIPGGITKVAYTGTESYITKPVTWSP